MHLEKDLFDRLIATLSRVPLARTKDGRDTFLTGIPNADSWQRHDTLNIDMTRIAKQASDTYIGDEEQSENWGLFYVINAAIKNADGTSLAKELKQLRQQCIDAWNQKHAVPTQPASSEQPSQPQVGNANTTPTHVLESDDTFEKPLANQIAIPPSQDNAQSTPPQGFLTESSIYIHQMQRNIADAARPFRDQSIGLVEPAACRKTITYLRQTDACLQRLSHLISSTEQFPREVAGHRHSFIEKTQFLNEQIGHLIEQVKEHCNASRDIMSKFLVIEQELTQFAPLTLRSEQKQDVDQDLSGPFHGR